MPDWIPIIIVHGPTHFIPFSPGLAWRVVDHIDFGDKFSAILPSSMFTRPAWNDNAGDRWSSSSSQIVLSIHILVGNAITPRQDSLFWLSMIMKSLLFMYILFGECDSGDGSYRPWSVSIWLGTGEDPFQLSDLQDNDRDAYRIRKAVRLLRFNPDRPWSEAIASTHTPFDLPWWPGTNHYWVNCYYSRYFVLRLAPKSTLRRFDLFTDVYIDLHMA